MAPRTEPVALTAAAAGMGFVLPVAEVPFATDPVMPARVLVLGAVLALGLLSASRERLSRRMTVALAVGVAVFVAAALLGRTPLLSLLGRYPRYEGLPMVAAYAAALAVGARVLAAAPGRRVFTSAVALAAAVNGLVAAGQSLFASHDRVTGLLSNSTTLGTFGLVALGVVGWSLLAHPRPLLWAGAAGAAGCIALSASRGVLVGVGASLVVALLLRRRALARPKWYALVGAAVVVAVGAFLVPATAARVIGASPFADSTVSGRVLLWGESVRLWLSHPLAGVGPSRFVDAVNRFHTPEWAAAVGPYAPPDSPHDVVLQVLCATGVLGLAALVAIGVVALRDALALRSPLFVVSATVAAGLLATYLTSFTDPVTTTLGAFVVGGCLGVRHEAPQPRPLRIGTSVAVGVVALWLGVSLLVAEAQYSRALTATAPTEPAMSAVAARPWDPDLTRRVAYTLSALAQKSGTDLRPVLVPLRDACARLPESTECLVTLSAATDVSGDHAAALAAAETALAVDPTDVDAHLARGIALAELSRQDEAEAAFLTAARLRPSAPEPWTDLARLYDTQGRTADASAARATAARLTKR
ncbi:MAG: O-antigen ligase family protein [Propionibacteriaceae bacterium]